MKRLKNFFEKNVNDVKKSIKTYPGAYILSVVMTILYLIVYDNDYFEKYKFLNLDSILMFYVTSLLGVIFIDVFFFSKEKHKIIGYIVDFAISTFFMLIKHDVIVINSADRIWICYLLVLLCFDFYFIFAKMKVNSHKYILDVFNNLFFYNLIFIIVDICLSTVIGIFMYLILESDSWEIIERLQIILIGGLFFPSIILAITKEKSNITLFIKNIIKFVLYPVTMIAIIIIYMYMAKILIIVETPANQIFRIVAFVFIIGYPFVLMTKNYVDDNKFYRISNKVVPWTFIPLIILQLYALILRTIQYGCTSNRYLAFFLVALELVILGLSLYNKRDILEKSLLIAIILTVVATVSPFNYEKIGFVGQLSMLKRIMPKGTQIEDLSIEKQRQVASICSYLWREDEKYMAKNIPEYLHDVVIEYKDITFDSLDEISEEIYDYEYVKYEIGTSIIEIKKYTEAEFIYKSDYSVEDNGRDNMYINLFKKLYEENDGEVENGLNKNNIIKKFKVDNDLCITSLDVTYRINKKNKKVEVESYDIEGMLLRSKKPKVMGEN